MIDFGKRLGKLKDRRQGSRERTIHESSMMDHIGMENAIKEGRDIRTKEFYENLKESDSIKYTIGAMAQVDEKSTQVSISEGNRVADSLMKSLQIRNIYTTSRLQGSVALNIHIKGHSDVDMLIIENETINIETPKLKDYLPATDPRSMVKIVQEIRLESEDILPRNFYKVEVNIKGNKSIAMSGGSLQRKVDIVPACWYDTHKYQQTNNESDRGIKIYHKGDHKLLLNLPFTHIKLISDRDDIYRGNLRSTIRLMKNMIADMPDGKKRIVKKLSSYDLASIAYHMDDKLYLPSEMRLGLVEKTREYLNYLLSYSYTRNSLDVPDGSRKIFDDEKKVIALEVLEKEFTALAEAIVKDLNPYMNEYNPNIILNKRVA